jgi:hypothetical protein
MERTAKTLSAWKPQLGDKLKLVATTSIVELGTTYTVRNGIHGIHAYNDDKGRSSYRDIRSGDHEELYEKIIPSPKTFGELTAEEQGALLLAHHNWSVIEYMSGSGFENRAHLWPDGGWRKIDAPAWNPKDAYRVMPEVEIETIETYWNKRHGFGINTDGRRGDLIKITFTLIDGEPDIDSIKMEKL